ncbi:soluble inorganic pyrophosphatase [Striga asiatica]|uniref:Soluble inorganic pyrophosphatase n=1 Tax=Striga asiatica TaxID=4170 RepID=A0A5A7RJD1_STRAF|nr:soluble inorganic pyrophosphatase [Striga asiatica]
MSVGNSQTVSIANLTDKKNENKEVVADEFLPATKACEAIQGSILLSFLRQENRVDVGDNSAVGNGDSGQKLPELLVVPHSQQQVPWDDPVPLVVPCSISSKLKNLNHRLTH